MTTSNNSKNKPLCWHYTTGQKLILIYKSGELRPSTAFVPAHEKPILWFTLNQNWDNTANKALRLRDGTIEFLDMQGTDEHCNGLVRIGVSEETTPFGWKALRHLSKMDHWMADGLSMSAIEVGVNPREWRGTFKNVPRSQWKAIEIFENGKWIAIENIRVKTTVGFHTVTASLKTNGQVAATIVNNKTSAITLELYDGVAVANKKLSALAA